MSTRNNNFSNRSQKGKIVVLRKKRFNDEEEDFNDEEEDFNDEEDTLNDR